MTPPPADKQLRKVDRGGGLHVQGGLRIRNLRLSSDSETGDLASSSMTTEIRTDTFPHWLGIAADASEEAESARTAALAAGLTTTASSTQRLSASTELQ